MLSVSSAECASLSQIPRLKSSDTVSVWEERRTSVSMWTISMKKSTLDPSQTSPWHVPTSKQLQFVSFAHSSIILRYFHRWLMAGFYLSFIIIVPFCYVKIYRYRKILIVPGSGQRNAEMTKFRKSRNIVTFSYNITIWSVEAVSAFVVIIPFPPHHPCTNYLFSRLCCAEFW